MNRAHLLWFCRRCEVASAGMPLSIQFPSTAPATHPAKVSCSLSPFFPAPFMFLPAAPMRLVSVRHSDRPHHRFASKRRRPEAVAPQQSEAVAGNGTNAGTSAPALPQPRRRGTLRSMQNSAPLHPRPSASGLTLVELDSSPAAFQVVGVSAAWHKLLMQADMAAPHMQVAAIEGESGSGKQTLARYLFSRSPLSGSSFQRRDAREWLATDADPAHARRLHLSRSRRPARPSRPGTPARRPQNPPGPSARPRRRIGLLANTAAPDGRPGTSASRPRFPAHRHPTCHPSAAPAPRRHRPARPVPARPHLQPLPAASCSFWGPATLARLLQHNWPGNVRELASVLETALLEADNGVIRPIDLALPDGLPPHFDVSFGARLGASTQVNPWANPSAGPGAMFDPQSAARSANLSLDAVIHSTSSTCSTSTAATSSAPPASSPSAALLSIASSPTKPCWPSEFVTGHLRGVWSGNFSTYSGANWLSLLTRNWDAPDPRTVLLLRITHGLRQRNFLVGTQFHHLGERLTVHHAAHHNRESFRGTNR